jgi:hypothetical protein
MEEIKEAKKKFERIERLLNEIISEYESVLHSRSHFHIDHVKSIKLINSFEDNKKLVQDLKQDIQKELTNVCHHNITFDVFDYHPEQSVALKFCCNCEHVFES